MVIQTRLNGVSAPRTHTHCNPLFARHIRQHQLRDLAAMAHLLLLKGGFVSATSHCLVALTDRLGRNIITGALRPIIDQLLHLVNYGLADSDKWQLRKEVTLTLTLTLI
jgi:hypothetical protein